MTWMTDVADYLTTNSLGTQGTNLFIGFMPDTDTLVTLLSEYDGTVNETFASGIALSQPSLQIRVRGATEDYTTPRTRLKDIVTLLQAVTNQTIGSTYFVRIRPSTTILAMGQDARLRYEFSANFEVTYAGV